MALTATASPSVRQKIKELLALKDEMEIIESPDRDNIILTVTKLSGDVASSFKWLTEKLSVDGKRCPKHLIYCRRISDCSKLYRFFEDELGDKAYTERGAKKSENRLFNMYHSRTIDKIKQDILQSIPNRDSNLRVLIATNAVGMGLDFQCNYVINYGPPSEFDDYLQQIGRVGRDGTQSHSVLLYHGQQLRKVTPEMLSFVKNTEICRRKMLKTLYGDKNCETEIKGCRCCDICFKDCRCGHCESQTLPFLNVEDSKLEFQMEREINDEDIMKLETHLLGLKNELDRDIKKPSYSSVFKGLSFDMVQSVITNARYIFNVDFLLDECGFLDFSTANMVLGIFSSLFGDTDEDILFDEDTLPVTEGMNFLPLLQITYMYMINNHFLFLPP